MWASAPAAHFATVPFSMISRSRSALAELRSATGGLEAVLEQNRLRNSLILLGFQALGDSVSPSVMIFPYLSSTPPETQAFCLSGKSIRRPGAYRVHGPFYPSVVLTEPSFGRKSHYAVMDLRLNPEAVRLLQASFRSDLLIVLASTADVAPHLLTLRLWACIISIEKWDDILANFSTEACYGNQT